MSRLEAKYLHHHNSNGCFGGVHLATMVGNPFVLAAARGAEFQNNAAGMNVGNNMGFDMGFGNQMANGFQNLAMGFGTPQMPMNQPMNPMGAFGQGIGPQRPRMQHPKFYPNMVVDCRLATTESLSEDNDVEFVHVALNNVQGV